MNRRDVAVLTFRAIALWPVVTGLTQALEAIITWRVAYPVWLGAVRDAGLPTASSGQLLFMTIGALLARVIIGALLWLSSDTLARIAVGEGGDVPIADRRSLYLSAMFLAGTWFLASAVPTATYWLFWAVRTGWRPHETEEGAQLAELAARVLVGAALLRGSWLLPAELRNRNEPH